MKLIDPNTYTGFYRPVKIDNQLLHKAIDDATDITSKESIQFNWHNCWPRYKTIKSQANCWGRIMRENKC